MSRLALRFALLALALWIAIALALSGRFEDHEFARTAALFALALCLPLWCCWRRWDQTAAWGLDVFQPGTVMAVLFFAYAVIPAAHVWLDGDYQSDWTPATWPPARLFQRTLLLWVLGLMAFGIGYRLTGRRPHAPLPPPTGLTARWPRIATGTALAMLAIGLPFRLYHFAALGGFTPNVFLFLSPDYTAESGINVGGIVTLLETFFDWGALLLIIRAIVTNRHKLVTGLIAGAAVLLAYVLSGKRSAVLPFLFFPLTWVHYLKRRIGVGGGLVYLAAAFAVVTVLLLLRYVGPLLAWGGLSPAVVLHPIVAEPLQFYVRTPELATFDMTMLAVGDRTLLLDKIGGVFRGGLQYNLAPVAYVIPRFLWPGKGTFRDLGQVFFQHAVGGGEDIGFAVGIVGGLYLFAGLLGVLLGMAVVGALFRLAYERLRPGTGELSRVFLYAIVLWMAFLLLRFGTLGFTLLYFIQFELPGVLVALLVLRSRPPPHSRSLQAT